MKRKRFFRNLKLLNPKNLAKEVHVYGYHFSWKAHAMTILCSLLGISAIGVLFKLEPVYFSVMIAVVVLILPVFILNMYKSMFEQKRFADAVTYGEQILYSFQKSQKVAAALKETRELFEDGRMRDVIDEAVEYLESGNVRTESNILREALGMIERKYTCGKIHMIHELLINSEEHGGEVSNSILLLLNDIELWKRRGYMLQAEKKTSNRDNMISIGVATILCAVALYVLDAMGKMFPGVESINIFSVGMIQVSSFCFIIFMVYVLAKSMNGLTQNWLQSDSIYNKEYVLASYDKVMNYDESGGRRKQIVVSVLFFIGAAAAFYLGKAWLGIICILAVIITLIWNRIGYALAKKDVNDELYLALPQWLMELALLLQNNNVQVSLIKSISEAPFILKKELELLQMRLQEKPNALHSYTDFCKNFDVPEAQSCMKMLHAISESGTGNVSIQIDHLIGRVHEMQNMADDIKSKNLAFRMKLLFSYPVLGATVKLMTDLSIGMLFMFQMISNIGGLYK